MAQYHIRIVFDDPRSMMAAARNAHVEVIRQTMRRGEAGATVSAIATEEQIQELEAAGLTVERRESIDEGMQARQAEVGQGNRYAERLRSLRGQ